MQLCQGLEFNPSPQAEASQLLNFSSYSEVNKSIIIKGKASQQLLLTSFTLIILAVKLALTMIAFVRVLFFFWTEDSTM